MGEKKRHYEQWTAEEKRQLIQIVSQFTFNERISWRDVVKSFPGRSLQ